MFVNILRTCVNFFTSLHIALVWEMRNVSKSLVVKPAGKRPHGRIRCRWEDNIITYVAGIGWEVVDWIRLAQDKDWWRAVVKKVMNLRIP
jgi:hypothetical protein